MRSKCVLSLILAMLLCVGSAFAGTVTWDGGGADNNWSTAANWDGDVVPTSADDVVFDDTSVKDCTVDGNVEVASLWITTDYTGTVSAGAVTVTVNTGDFDDSYNHFSSTTATITFTGSDTQRLMYLNCSGTYGHIRNEKTGGYLQFYWGNVVLQSLTVLPGTMTKLTVHTFNLNAIDLQGEAGNPATLQSVADTDACQFRLNGMQTVQYVEFKGIDASDAMTLDGSVGCVDSGLNQNINWNGVKTWDGGGADENWSTAENWSGDTVPAASQSVVFNSTSSKDCQMDANVTVGTFEIGSDYAGEVNGNDYVLTIAGDYFRDTSGKFEKDDSHLRFVGSASQTIRANNYQTFEEIVNANTAGALDFYCLHISVQKFVALPGTESKLTTCDFFTSELDLQGDASSTALICSRSTSDPTNLKLSGSQTIAYVEFENIDASGGQAVDASDNCTDLGGNTNVNFTGVKTWDGEGADENWSTAANWSGDTVPTSVQDVVFDGTSSKNCVIDVDVVTPSFKVMETYEGKVNFGSSRIEITSGDLELLYYQFDAGTSTIVFSGDADQQFEYRNNTFYNIENAKTGGTLTWTGWHTYLNSFKAAAGTTTKVTNVTMNLNTLDLQGTASAPIVIKTFSTGDTCVLSLNETQTISYVDFQDIDASGGDIIDASDNCTDSGNNTNVIFTEVKWWDGEGADTNWSTAENWSGDTVPTTEDFILFTASTTKGCTIDTSATITGLQINAHYEGTVELGTSTLTLTRDGFLNYGDAARFDAGTGTLVIDSADEELVSCPSGQILPNVEIASGKVLFAESATLASLTMAAGTTVAVESGKTLTTSELDLQGTSTNPVTLKCEDNTGTWGLSHLGTQSVAYAVVRACDASSGSQIDGTTNCTDLGDNTNWLFDAADGIDLPSASVVSPVCIEGWVQGATPAAVTIAVNSGSANDVNMLSAKGWFDNVALSSASATAVSVKYDGVEQAAQDITWTPTDLVGKDAASDTKKLRLCDSLLFTADGTGTELTIDVDGDGTADYTGVPGDTFAYEYQTAGTYTVTAKIDGTSVGTYSVKVIGVDLTTKTLGCWVGNEVTHTVTVNLAGSDSDVWFGAANASHMTVTKGTAAGTSVPLTCVALNTPEYTTLIARIGDEDGSIAAYKQASCFDLEWSTNEYFPVIIHYDNDDVLIGSCIRLAPWPEGGIEGVKVRIILYSGNGVFEDGSSEKIVDSSEFDRLGQYNFYILAPKQDKYCHHVSIVEEE